MTRPRQQIVSLDDTAYYHCTSRCVRGARLLGRNPRHKHDHRRKILLDRLRQLASLFSIDVAAYAILHNHYHLVLRVDRQRALQWSDQEVARRWFSLHPRSPLARRFLDDQPLSPEELSSIQDRIPTWRERLFSLSWFMRALNEHVARRLNREDGKSGRFWQGRFHSQALLDDTALLACMAYVDLNPIRAGKALSPETSDFTSIQNRIRQWQESSAPQQSPPARPEGPTLLPLGAGGIPIPFQDYLQLVEWTGREIRKEGAASIPHSLPPILERLGMSGSSWTDQVNRFKLPHRWVFGPLEQLRLAARRLEQRWVRGVGDPQARHSFSFG